MPQKLLESSFEFIIYICDGPRIFHHLKPDLIIPNFISFHSPVVTNTLNEKKLAPIHLATELNKVKALEVMGKYRNVIDIQQGKEMSALTKNC